MTQIMGFKKKSRIFSFKATRFNLKRVNKKKTYLGIISFPMVQQTLVGQGLFVIEALRSH